MGQEATELLKRLEYRGYDSTGASFIDKDRTIVLVKKTGAPSTVTRELDIPSFRGQRFIGQVRWATYGAVTDTNSQPHLVRCKVTMVGAHNGNISNTDNLKASLSARGHKVLSDNDGEMIVHLVEEHYAANLASPKAPLAAMRQAWNESGLAGQVSGQTPAPSSAAIPDPIPDEVLLIMDAIRKAEAETEGSYAAAVADPQVPGVFAIKSGSSLYAGLGKDAQGDFVVVSSDLTSVLSKTSMLIPLHEGEGLWYTENRYVLFKLQGKPEFSIPALKRSRLNVRDTALDPRYRYYMEQEIHSAPDTIDEIIRCYFDDPAETALGLLFDEKAELVKDLLDEASALSIHADERALASTATALCNSVDFKALSSRIKTDPKSRNCLATHKSYHSDEAQLLAEIARAAPKLANSLALLDLAFIWEKRRSVMRYAHQLIGRMHDARDRGGSIYLVASGTSYHAALTGAYFWSGLARLAVYPCNPGLFRSAYMDCLKPEDFVLAISQSGETKDLVDILQDIQERHPTVGRVSLVNNENSRIPQELSDFYLPLLCGPEIAVAATKSFINQLAVLYILAASATLPEVQVLAKLRQAQALITATLEQSAPDLDRLAGELHLCPSLHLLGAGSVGLAKEGALKIREVVLNHAEGYDTAEFKHGPNTILGKNTIFSIPEVEKAIDAAIDITLMTAIADAPGAAPASAPRPAMQASALLRSHPEIMEGLFSDYPLIFVCPPDERDIRIAISQIHTHKIRGARIILIAEKNVELELAVKGVPAGRKDYHSAYVQLPASGSAGTSASGKADRNLFVFAATAALQYLAFRMSVLKMEYLDKLGIADHGVHPDAPKNVSKSITVD
jgi:glucosamine 6-phosphate synthetase-like amidotransferase/phosphosugar isomerase protein